MTSPAMNLLPYSPVPSEKITILLVSPHTDDLANLRNILHHRDWIIVHCGSYAEAATHLQSGGFSVVVTETVLPDGCWKDVLHKSEGHSQAPLVLVVSRHADDRLWAEVLNLGGYDLLLKPFDRSEVTRVVGSAWRCWFGAVRRSQRIRSLHQHLREARATVTEHSATVAKHRSCQGISRFLYTA